MSVATICQPGSLVINAANLPTGAGVPYVQNPMTSNLNVNGNEINSVEKITLAGSDQAGVSAFENQIVADANGGTIITGFSNVSLLSSSGQIQIGTSYNPSVILTSDNTNGAFSAFGNITLTSASKNITINAGSIEIPADAQYAIGATNAIEVDNGNMVFANTNGIFNITNKALTGRIYDSVINPPPNPFQCASASAEQNPTTYISYGTFTRITSASDAYVVLLNEDTQTVANLMVGIISDPSNTNGFIVVYNTSTGTANITFTSSDAGKLVYLVRTGPDNMIRVSGW